MDSSEHVDAMDVEPDHGRSYIEKDATYLTTGETALFPSTIRYMDLTILDVTHFTRTPQLMSETSGITWWISLISRKGLLKEVLSLQANPALVSTIIALDSYYSQLTNYF